MPINDKHRISGRALSLTFSADGTNLKLRRPVLLLLLRLDGVTRHCFLCLLLAAAAAADEDGGNGGAGAALEVQVEVALAAEGLLAALALVGVQVHVVVICNGGGGGGYIPKSHMMNASEIH